MLGKWRRSMRSVTVLNQNGSPAVALKLAVSWGLTKLCANRFCVPINSPAFSANTLSDKTLDLCLEALFRKGVGVPCDFRNIKVFFHLLKLHKSLR